MSTCRIIEFTVEADYRVKNEENEKKYNYYDLAWEMRVIVIPIVIGAFGAVPKYLERGLEELKIGGRIEIIQTTAL